MNFSYRRAEHSDVDIIAEFNLRLALETEGLNLDRQTLRAGVTRGLALFPEAQYFLAESESTVRGQLMVTREWSDWRNGWMLWLQSVFVQKEYRSRGVFRGLLSYAAKAVTDNCDTVALRLYVNSENETAINVYRQIGFCDAGYRVMEIRPLDANMLSSDYC